LLGSRILAALHDAEPWRGAPLGASVGVAALGEDGDDAAALIETAEQRALLAAASGISIGGPTTIGRPD
jgi:GGDEF domain-containing protein